MRNESFESAPTTKDLLFFTCATRFYENFVPPYIYFAGLHNPGAIFEFVVDNIQEFQGRHQDSLNWLRNRLKTTIHLRERSALIAKPHMENSIRFVIEPEQVANYVYIGDIDIMILEDIAAWHKPVFDAGLPYSNIVRAGTKRLSGLHFAKYSAQYPLPDIADLVEKFPNDEELLHAIMARKGLLYDNKAYYTIKNGRPIHGLHLSLNRLPFSYHKERVSWGMTYGHLAHAAEIFEGGEFNEFFGTLYPGSAQILVNLIYISRGVCSYGEEHFRRFTSMKEQAPSPRLPPSESSMLKEKFSRIYEKNAWGNPESKSGPSSTLARTVQIRQLLPELLNRHHITSVLDAPCGDLNWISMLLRDGAIQHYIGADIVEEVIAENARKFADLGNARFMDLDITKDKLPTADILLCRDCLFHFSYADIRKFLTNFSKSEIPLLLTTTHYNSSKFSNKDISTGGWRWFDLFSTPFSFPAPVDRIPDGSDRELVLFTRQQIADLLLKWNGAEKFVSTRNYGNEAFD